MASAVNRGMVGVDSRDGRVYREPGRRGRRSSGRAAWLLAGVLSAAAAAEEPLGDPMRPPTMQPETTAPTPGERVGRLQLTSTVVGPERRIAVIDGRRLRVGDRIAGARVTAIDPASVRLVAQGRRFTLRLLQQPIKSPAAGADER